MQILEGLWQGPGDLECRGDMCYPVDVDPYRRSALMHSCAHIRFATHSRAPWFWLFPTQSLMARSAAHDCTRIISVFTFCVRESRHGKICRPRGCTGWCMYALAGLFILWFVRTRDGPICTKALTTTRVLLCAGARALSSWNSGSMRRKLGPSGDCSR